MPKNYYCNTCNFECTKYSNLVNHNNYHLPSNYNYNTFHKINDMNNTAYIDVLCSFLFGNLTHYKKNPSFPLYYGSVNGIGDYNYDLTEDYDDIKNQIFDIKYNLIEKHKRTFIKDIKWLASINKLSQRF